MHASSSHISNFKTEGPTKHYSVTPGEIPSILLGVSTSDRTHGERESSAAAVFPTFFEVLGNHFAIFSPNFRSVVDKSV